jgi:hypothetical protein
MSIVRDTCLSKSAIILLSLLLLAPAAVVAAPWGTVAMGTPVEDERLATAEKVSVNDNVMFCRVVFKPGILCS